MGRDRAGSCHEDPQHFSEEQEFSVFDQERAYGTSGLEAGSNGPLQGYHSVVGLFNINFLNYKNYLLFNH